MTYTANSCTPARALPCTTPRVRFSLLSFVSARLSLLRQRRALKSLDARALEDIGISRSEAMKEAERQIWDAPESWKG
ncbi:DUF1127 domain-containing protein [Pseudophaeobacter sp.]|uniref:DUF1127 domain-containing protein n=1 Tax=Pseudophaeobacter sp. TaxID=1971739 RepID=UPI00329954A9